MGKEDHEQQLMIRAKTENMFISSQLSASSGCPDPSMHTEYYSS